jgi:ribosomal protein S18 acetylase RimI-like enzyme
LIHVRKARPEDFAATARLLHLSAAEMYDRFTGGRERALRVLERSLGEPGNASSAEAIWVAEIDERPVAVMAAFPVDEAGDRSRAFLRLALRSSPPWRWPAALYLYWAGGRAAPTPPASAFYVDALATDPDFRRRGAARALLAEAEREARRRRIPAIALDTTIENAPARALYGREGYDEVAYQPPARGLAGFVALVKLLG